MNILILEPKDGTRYYFSFAEVESEFIKKNLGFYLTSVIRQISFAPVNSLLISVLLEHNQEENLCLYLSFPYFVEKIKGRNFSVEDARKDWGLKLFYGLCLFCLHRSGDLLIQEELNSKLGVDWQKRSLERLF